MLADDLPFIDGLARADEQGAALLEVFQSVGGRAARFRGNHDPVGTARNVAAHRLVIVEVVVHDRLAAGGIQEPRAQANQAAGRDREFDVRHLAARIHLEAFAAPVADSFHNGADARRRRVDDQVLDGFHHLAVHLFGDDARLADRKFEPLAAHVFQQDGQVQQAAAGDEELVAAFLARPHAQGNIRFQLLHQTLAQLPAGDVRSRLADERRIVDAEEHVKRRFIHVDRRQGDRVIEVGNRVADVHVV